MLRELYLHNNNVDYKLNKLLLLHLNY